MDDRFAPTHEDEAQRLADLQEHLDLVRYPSRLEMLRAVNDAARRADSVARLEHALRRPTGSRFSE